MVTNVSEENFTSIFRVYFWLSPTGHHNPEDHGRHLESMFNALNKVYMFLLLKGTVILAHINKRVSNLEGNCKVPKTCSSSWLRRSRITLFVWGASTSTTCHHTYRSAAETEMTSNQLTSLALTTIPTATCQTKDSIT
jgi:hypothetical protein